MAEIQEDLEVSDIGELEAVSQQQAEKAPDDGYEIPKHLQGKSIADLAKMHHEAEKLIGKQAQEVHEVRKLADELIKSQLAPKAEPEKPKEIDFFENPQEAIRQQIENSPQVLAATQYAKQAQVEQARQTLARLHPDAREVVADSSFQEWVKASRVRTQLFQQADGYDVEAANELLSTFKEIRGARQKVVTQADTTARDKTLKAAAVDTGGSGESSQKVYRRADLIRLKMRDPAKYESMSDDIMAAYQTGRVK